MKRRRHFLGSSDGDVGGGERVHGALQSLGLVAPARLKAEHLSLGMHASVSPAGKLNHDGLLGYPQQKLLQNALHGAQARLHLKAVKVGAVVLDDELEF